jgi:hypothetical protein
MDWIGPLKYYGEGRFFTLSGLRYAFLVVNQTKAKIMSCQKTRNTGQMIPSKPETV